MKITGREWYIIKPFLSHHWWDRNGFMMYHSLPPMVGRNGTSQIHSLPPMVGRNGFMMYHFLPVIFIGDHCSKKYNVIERKRVRRDCVFLGLAGLPLGKHSPSLLFSFQYISDMSRKQGEEQGGLCVVSSKGHTQSSLLPPNNSRILLLRH